MFDPLNQSPVIVRRISDIAQDVQIQHSEYKDGEYTGDHHKPMASQLFSFDPMDQDPTCDIIG